MRRPERRHACPPHGRDTLVEAGAHPSSCVQIYRSTGLTIALEIYLSTPGSETQAAEVFWEIVGRFTRFYQADILACSRVAFKALLTREDGNRLLPQVLKIPPEVLRSAGERAAHMVKTWLS
ncbi:hypothetical protein PspLS_11757 [Pyricularia sp. CBS 133598]|nr:hypothetical protein PspLS_11757 [Pyricularia sp. CBS 133598]